MSLLQITLDEYDLVVEFCRFDVEWFVVSGDVGLEDQTVRDLTEDECEQVGKKHECLIDELVRAKAEEMHDDDLADDAIENFINSREFAA